MKASKLAQRFAEKYNAMAPHEQAFEFGLNHTFHSGNDFKGFKFEDGSRFEFNTDADHELTGKSVEWFSEQELSRR